MKKHRIKNLVLSTETLRRLSTPGADPKEGTYTYDAYCPSRALVGCSVDVCPGAKPPA